MLKIKNLKVRLGSFLLTANFTIMSGEKIAIIGPSGGGKSTLLSTIAGFIKQDSGEIYYFNQNFYDIPPSKLPCTLVFQDNNLFPHLDIFQNVALGINPRLNLSKFEKEFVLNCIEKVGLLPHMSKTPNMLSGGQISRVALARALLREQPILMLDEAFSALGPALRLEMLDFLKDILSSSTTSLLMVTHDPRDASYIADKIIFVSNGKASPPKQKEAFFAKPASEVREYLGSEKLNFNQSK